MVSLLLTLNIFQPCSSVSIVNLEQVITGWAKAPEALISGNNVLKFYILSDK